MPIVAQLTITLDDKGSISVNGPLDQLMLCYGLIEMARDTVRRNADEKAKRVQVPSLGDVSAFARRT